MRPKFSIAIPAYNRSDYLRQAIKSCLAQTTPDFEVIISDDCSTEDLNAVANSFSDTRIVYSRSAIRLGAATNHQRAVGLSRGIYIINLHSDDMLLPEYLEIAGHALDKCEHAAAGYCSMIFLRGSVLGEWQMVPRIRFADKTIYSENRWLEKCRNVVPTCCMFRKTAFDQVGGYRITLKFAYDWDLFMRFMTLASGVMFIPEILAIYRQHSEQASNKELAAHLYDTLDLWELGEYSHWTEGEIADLVLTNLARLLRDRVGVSELAQKYSSKGLVVACHQRKPLGYLQAFGAPDRTSRTADQRAF